MTLEMHYPFMIFYFDLVFFSRGKDFRPSQQNVERCKVQGMGVYKRLYILGRCYRPLENNVGVVYIRDKVWSDRFTDRSRHPYLSDPVRVLYTSMDKMKELNAN